MTQQPFTRRGAIDLSALKRPATPPPGAGAPAGAPAGGAPAGPSSYAVSVTAENFQQVLETSMTAPVLLVLFSRGRMPESGQLADDLVTLSAEFEGRFLAGLVDVDVSPQIAQAMQVQSIPLVVAVLDGRPAPLFQDVVPIDELRTALTQVMQQLTSQGMTARHQPLSGAAPAEDGEEPAADPRYAAAEEALARDDVDTAVAEYQKLVSANPADAEAVAGLAMAKVLQRTHDVDPVAVRAAADAAPADVDAQTLAADVDLAEGRPVEAFGRLVELVRVTAGKERDRAREHLIGLFAAVGNDDATVLQARQRLASALF
ncbi:tetratricopeptide repeat protein [Nocardioides dongxiaopingii]|uniref:tetratricopeptide repeat protein n=1 Tax=Nocardioides TaxID=1839 RepID=UPI0010C76BCD|nr:MULTISPECIES: tetratricopeptide repeat protein [Nocardioides]QCW50562.1 tetratricopeptide repeat protein [Nocardioides sp. S-1144]